MLQNLVPTSQRTSCISITKINLLILLRKSSNLCVYVMLFYQVVFTEVTAVFKTVLPEE
jgi:hypothetical protein